jgi:uncharacterized membrane protein
MAPIGFLTFAAFLFVGSHLVLSHPLRGPLVARLGERRFPAVYVPVALVTFGLMIAAAVWTPQEAPLWIAGDGLWAAATLLMWFGSILFVGSFESNPAFPNRSGEPVTEIGPPRGVFAITRHPMNWSFAIWGLVHIAVIATPSGVIVGGAILFLAIVGSIGQDTKKHRFVGPAWSEWMARTSFVPFGKGFAWPGARAVIGGTVLFLLATWLHQLVAPIPAGIWRWIG